MTGLDYVILAVIAISAAIGIWRGFVREALSLMVWVGAFWLAYAWGPYLESYLSGFIDERPIRLLVAFGAVFLAVHVAGFIVSRVLSKLIRTIGLRAVDRVAGGGFGILRGVVAIAALVLVIGMTPVKEEAFWQDSYMVAVFDSMLNWAQQYYPLVDLGGALRTATPKF